MLLPRGPVAEELLRTYAAYVGIDVNQAIDEYRRLHFSTPVEPPPALGGTVLAWRPPRWAILAIAAVLALAVGCGGIWVLIPAVWPHWPGVFGCWQCHRRPRLFQHQPRCPPLRQTRDTNADRDANSYVYADRHTHAHTGANCNHIADADAQALAEAA